MITLVQFGPAFDQPSASPFCVKTEILLKMVDLPYRTQVEDNPRKGPKGKLPLIIHKGQKIADSELIFHYLTNECGGLFDQQLNDEDKAVAKAFIRLCDHHLYWALVYTRWVHEDNWQYLKSVFFGNIPEPFQSLISGLVRRGVRRNLNGHGFGAHSATEIATLACQDIAALAQQLGEKPYLFGDQPSSADASAFAMLSAFLVRDMPSAIQNNIRGYPALIAYCDRMRQRFFPEADEPQKVAA